jgi:hypothetical protein
LKPRFLSLFLTPSLFLSLTFSVYSSNADPDHSRFDGVLKARVRGGAVDYEALKKEPADLARYLDEMAAVSRADFDGWDEKRQIAYLINLYNAATLNLILGRYPVKSIKDIGHVLKGPWDQPAVRLFGGTTTLNTIEHKILRQKYNEPRVHFALVCAAKGCPPLREEAYRPEVLDAQLDDQGRIFLATAGKNAFDPSRRIARLSPIFKWFKEDFAKKAGSVPAFLKPYLPAAFPADFISGSYRIEYTNYDWSLNDLQTRS